MSCRGDKLAIKVGGCFKSNTDPDADAERECLDPCNRPTEPTPNCPLGGTPRFEHWDYISGNTWISPRCGEDGLIVICGDNYEKYRSGMRVSVLGVGSYEIVAVTPQGLRVKNTGNAPDGVSYQNSGTLILTIGNHDGHWNDAECEDYPIADSGDIVVSNVEPEPEDCCAQGITRCKCKGVLEQGIGFLQSVVDGTRRVYRWVQDVMDRTLCNENMPEAQTADAVIGKKNNSCGVKIRPTSQCQYLKTVDGGVGFGQLDICCVPEGEFSLSESTLLQCRNGQTTRTNIADALQGYLQENDILGPCSYPDGGDAQETDKFIVCRNGAGVSVSLQPELIAAIRMTGSIASSLSIDAQKNVVSVSPIAPGSPSRVVIFNTLGIPSSNLIVLGHGFARGIGNSQTIVEPAIINPPSFLGNNTTVPVDVPNPTTLGPNPTSNFYYFELSVFRI